MKCEECEYGGVCVLTDSIGNRNIVSELEYHKNAAIHSIDEAIEHLLRLASKAELLFVNLDKKEYIEPRGGIKLRDLCTETANAILPYLLADGEKDGTPLMTNTSKEWVKNEKLKNGWRVLKEGEMFNEKYWIMEKVTRFFGRWSGDRIIVAGDYHTSRRKPRPSGRG